jgi:hypothetical protein
MTTQTLTKPRAATAGERDAASKAIPPEPIYPACKKLRETLIDYQSVTAELEVTRGKAARAQGDMDMLGESSLSEEESLKAISEANGRRSLYSSRIASLERKSAGLLAELRAELVAAVSEVTRLVALEVTRRTDILSKRVIDALGGIDEHVIVRGEQITVTRYSKLICLVERMRPSPLFSVGSMPAADVVRDASGVLKKLEGLTREIGKEI